MQHAGARVHRHAKTDEAAPIGRGDLKRSAAFRSQRIIWIDVCDIRALGVFSAIGSPEEGFSAPIYRVRMGRRDSRRIRD